MDPAVARAAERAERRERRRKVRNYYGTTKFGLPSSVVVFDLCSTMSRSKTTKSGQPVSGHGPLHQSKDERGYVSSSIPFRAHVLSFRAGIPSARNMCRSLFLFPLSPFRCPSLARPLPTKVTTSTTNDTSSATWSTLRIYRPRVSCCCFLPPPRPSQYNWFHQYMGRHRLAQRPGGRHGRVVRRHAGAGSRRGHLYAESDMRLMLLRHWTLYDASASRPSSRRRLKVWKDHGKQRLDSGAPRREDRSTGQAGVYLWSRLGGGGSGSGGGAGVHASRCIGQAGIERTHRLLSGHPSLGYSIPRKQRSDNPNSSSNPSLTGALLVVVFFFSPSPGVLFSPLLQVEARRAATGERRGKLAPAKSWREIRPTPSYRRSSAPRGFRGARRRPMSSLRATLSRKPRGCSGSLRAVIHVGRQQRRAGHQHGRRPRQ